MCSSSSKWSSSSESNKANENFKKVVNALGMATIVFSSCVSAAGAQQIPKNFSVNSSAKHWNRYDDDCWSTACQTEEKGSQEEQHKLLCVADIIRKVKVDLGLSNKDIATIFSISRPTLYAYLDDSEREHTIKQNIRDRASVIDRIITEISIIFERSPGAMAKNFKLDGESLFDLLKQSELNQEKILNISSHLAARMKEHSSSSSVASSFALDELTPHV